MKEQKAERKERKGGFITVTEQYGGNVGPAIMVIFIVPFISSLFSSRHALYLGIVDELETG